MRKDFLFIFGFLIIILSIGSVLAGQTPLQASVALQDVGDFSGRNIYFGETNGEASRFDRSENGLSRYAGLIRQLGAELHTLEWRRGIPGDADLVILIGASIDLDEDQVARLWSYLNQGGRLLLITDPPVAGYSAFLQNVGLFGLTWTDWGIRTKNDVVAIEAGTRLIQPSEIATPEANPNNPTVGSETAQIEVPILNTEFTTDNIANHPVTSGLSSVLFFSRSRSIEVDASIQDVTLTPLIFSPPEYYGETAFGQYLEASEADYNFLTDTGRGSLLLAAALEYQTSGARLVVIGDREFATNGHGLVTSPNYSASFIYPGNAQVLLQATSWLLESQVVLPTFPTPAPTATPTPTPTMTPTPSF